MTAQAQPTTLTVSTHRPWAFWARLAAFAAISLPGLLHVSLVATDLSSYVATGPFDWNTLAAGAERIANGLDPFAQLDPTTSTSFRWSPIAAWLLVPLTAAPWAAWAALHVGALVLLRDWRLIAIVGLSWPFLLDVIDGGVMTFVAVAAYWAYRGRRLGGIAFLALALLIPRPIMLPLVAWLMWSRPTWRIPFAVALLAHAGAVVVTGWHVELAERLLTLSQQEMFVSFNLAPSRWIGTAWVPIGVALAAFLTWRGRIGWASVAIAPYLLPPYALMLLLEWPRWVGLRAGQTYPASRELRARAA